LANLVEAEQAKLHAHMSRKVKEVIRAAGLRDKLSFASFRHGGFTESGDAEFRLRAEALHRG
jgi:hypothetical protein